MAKKKTGKKEPAPKAAGAAAPRTKPAEVKEKQTALVSTDIRQDYRKRLLGGYLAKSTGIPPVKPRSR